MLIIGERESLPFADCLQNLPAARLEKPLHCPARNAHQLSGFFLLHSLEIADAHRLEFVEAELDDVEFGERDSRWLKEVVSLDSTAVTELLSARHDARSIGCTAFESNVNGASGLAHTVHMHIIGLALLEEVCHAGV
jgi:hypothetical protein